MTHYLISFPAAAMEVTADELPEVGRASRAVIQEAKDAGVYVFGGGLDADVTPVRVAGDGSPDDGYPQWKGVDGGMTVLKLESREAALEWAAKLAIACRCAQDVREFMYDPKS